MVVSIQKLTARKYITPTQMRGHFYPIKVFSSLSHDDSSFVGASDVSQFSVLYGYVLFGAPDQGQTLDVYRSDF